MAGHQAVSRLIREPVFSLMGRSSLWDGGDHLLVVEQRGFQETYRRFYYGDIQAVIVAGSDRRLYFAIAFFLFLLSGLLVAAFSTGSVGKLTGLGTVLLFGGLLLANLIKGPTCVCCLKTSVSLIRFQAVTRWSQIDGLLPELRRRIEENQGEGMAGEPEYPRREEDLPAPSKSESRTGAIYSSPARGDAGSAGLSQPPGAPTWLHRVLFPLLMADAFLALTAFAWTNPVTVGIRAVIILAACLVGMGALAVQRRAKVGKVLQGATIATVSYLTLGVLGIYHTLVILRVQWQIADPEKSAPFTGNIVRELATVSPYDGPVWFFLFGSNLVLSALFGVIGLLYSQGWRGSAKSATPPPLGSAS